MKPPRADIAVPPFPPSLQWVGDPPPAIERLCARGPVIVHFLDVGHLSSVRTLPYLSAWRDRYAPSGLTVLGVNSPRFPFTGRREKLAAALARLELDFPVAVDSDRAAWKAYGCEGWPSLFLWGQGGALRWFQFGEGEYLATEQEIQALLPERARTASLPEPMEPLRPSDAPGARVVPPTVEVFPGGDASRPWRVSAGDPPLELAYEGAGVAVTADGEGELSFRIDTGPEQALPVDAPGLYELAGHERHGSHRLQLRPTPGLNVYAVAFAPGPP